MKTIMLTALLAASFSALAAGDRPVQHYIDAAINNNAEIIDEYEARKQKTITLEESKTRLIKAARKYETATKSSELRSLVYDLHELYSETQLSGHGNQALIAWKLYNEVSEELSKQSAAEMRNAYRN